MVDIFTAFPELFSLGSFCAPVSASLFRAGLGLVLTTGLTVVDISGLDSLDTSFGSLTGSSAAEMFELFGIIVGSGLVVVISGSSTSRFLGCLPSCPALSAAVLAAAAAAFAALACSSAFVALLAAFWADVLAAATTVSASTVILPALAASSFVVSKAVSALVFSSAALSAAF